MPKVPKEKFDSRSPRTIRIAAVAVIILVTAIRIRLLPMPLERDEGEFAYMGQLILQGIPPYELAYSMKLPGVFVIYGAVMAVFGQSPAAVHVGLLLVNLTACALIFLLGRRLWDASTGMVAAATYAVLSVDPSVMGTAAHATQFVVPAALGGLLLLLGGLDSRRTSTLFWSGTLLGSAFVIKQHAVMFPIFAGGYLLYQLAGTQRMPARAIAKAMGAFILGAAAPFAATCLALWRAGVFDRFWFWTFDYARQYATEVPLSVGLKVLMGMHRIAFGPWAGLWVLAGVGMVVLFADRRNRINALFVTGLLLFSLLAVCPGFYLREHYFVQMLPAVSLLAALAINWSSRLLRRRYILTAIPVIVLITAAAFPMLQHRGLYFESTPAEACRRIYQSNPFEESLEIASYIREHSSPGDRIAVLGSEPQIYFYTQRLSATGYLYTYGLMEPQRYASVMQQQMIDEVEDAKPVYVVLVNISNSWLVRPDSDLSIIDWAQDYLGRDYTLEGVTEIDRTQETRYVWGYDARSHVRESTRYIYVFRRNPPS